MPLAAENHLIFAAFDVLKTRPLYVILSIIVNICSVLAPTHHKLKRIKAALS
jgi:hypothetical protein